jgi:hypothetical protein
MEAKRTRKLCHQYFPSFLYIGCPIKVEHISAEQLWIVLNNLPLKKFGNLLHTLFPSLLHRLCAIMCVCVCFWPPVTTGLL